MTSVVDRFRPVAWRLVTLGWVVLALATTAIVKVSAQITQPAQTSAAPELVDARGGFLYGTSAKAAPLDQFFVEPPCAAFQYRVPAGFEGPLYLEVLDESSTVSAEIDLWAQPGSHRALWDLHRRSVQTHSPDFLRRDAEAADVLFSHLASRFLDRPDLTSPEPSRGMTTEPPAPLDALWARVMAIGGQKGAGPIVSAGTYTAVLGKNISGRFVRISPSRTFHIVQSSVR